MARGAGVDLVRGQLLGAPGNAGLGVHLPVTMIGWLEPIGQAHPVGTFRRVGLLARFGPGDMPRAWPVARLTRHVEIGPARCVAIGGEIVVLSQIGRVAVSALVIPGLVASGPMQSVAGG